MNSLTTPYKIKRSACTSFDCYLCKIGLIIMHVKMLFFSECKHINYLIQRSTIHHSTLQHNTHSTPLRMKYTYDRQLTSQLVGVLSPVNRKGYIRADTYNRKQQRQNISNRGNVHQNHENKDQSISQSINQSIERSINQSSVAHNYGLSCVELETL